MEKSHGGLFVYEFISFTNLAGAYIELIHRWKVYLASEQVPSIGRKFLLERWWSYTNFYATEYLEMEIPDS